MSTRGDSGLSLTAEHWPRGAVGALSQLLANDCEVLLRWAYLVVAGCPILPPRTGQNVLLYAPGGCDHFSPAQAQVTRVLVNSASPRCLTSGTSHLFVGLGFFIHLTGDADTCISFCHKEGASHWQEGSLQTSQCYPCERGYYILNTPACLKNSLLMLVGP